MELAFKERNRYYLACELSGAELAEEQKKQSAPESLLADYSAYILRSSSFNLCQVRMEAVNRKLVKSCSSVFMRARPQLSKKLERFFAKNISSARSLLEETSLPWESIREFSSKREKRASSK